MKKLQTLLHQLARPEVTELALTTGQPARLATADGAETVGGVLDSEAILELLFLTGGSRYVDDLGAKPVQWKARVDGVGAVTVTASQRGDVVDARIVVPGRDAARPSKRLPKPRAPSIEMRAASRSSVTARPKKAPPPTVPPVRHALSEPFGLAPAFTEPQRGDAARGPMPTMPADAPPPNRAAITAREAPRRARGGHGALLARLLEAAREENASDLHLVAGRPPLLRVAGALAAGGDPLDAEVVAAMLLEIVPPRLSRRLEAEGSCDFAVELPPSGRLRVNVSRQRTGYKGSFRLIAPEIPTLASLGLPDAIGAATKHHQGLVLITGPTGHGKTSTLAALVDILNTETSHHVLTVEDPVEYLHPRKKAMISQREVGTHTRSFESALKASLREDPDVIVVGELRDAETVRMALAASETGHLVLGTMNTPNAAKTIDRLIDLFPPADQQQVRTTVSGGLRMIVSQRLLPTTDGTGRVAAAEVLPGSIPLWNLIRDGKTFQIPSLQQRGKALGIIRQIDSLAELVRSGKTSLAAALAAAEAPDELRAMLQNASPAAPQRPPGRTPSGASKGLLHRAGALFKKGT